VKPKEHFSEATRLAAQAEAKSREPNQPFDPAPWLKAQTHALLALCGEMAALREMLTPPPPPVPRVTEEDVDRREAENDRRMAALIEQERE
jgi:hypothetical protein